MDRVEPIVYKCTGIDGRGEPCLKTLFIYRPPMVEPIPGAGARRADLGTIEQKCRRCKLVNVFSLGDHATAIRGLQK
jgi:hypothetical protein